MAYKHQTTIFGFHDDGIRKRKISSRTANRLPPRLGANRPRLPVDANRMLHASSARGSGNYTCDEEIRNEWIKIGSDHIMPTRFSISKKLRSVISSIFALSEKTGTQLIAALLQNLSKCSNGGMSAIRERKTFKDLCDAELTLT